MADASRYWNEIENEHSAIVGLLSRVHKLATQKPPEIGVIVSAYQVVVRKFEEHFANEERIMAETRFPDAAEHQRHHQVLLIRLLSICDRMKTSRTLEGDQLRLTLQSLFDDATGADVSLREHLEQ
jgi:hemerythrin-like metal-binding protein